MVQLKRIALIGYRGTGKTAVGRLLADSLGWTFLDLDAVIEARVGKSIVEIFAEEGEVGFRERESNLFAEVCRTDHQVIATGGGVVLRDANRELLGESTYVAWLTAPPELLWERLTSDPLTAARRPNLTAAGGLAEIVELLTAREPLYRSLAAATFSTVGRSPEQVAGDILAAWRISSCSP